MKSCKLVTNACRGCRERGTSPHTAGRNISCLQPLQKTGRSFLKRLIYLPYDLAILLSHPVVFDSINPQTAARQAPLSMGICQARILDWVAMPSSKVSSQPRFPTLQMDSFLGITQTKP